MVKNIHYFRVAPQYGVSGTVVTIDFPAHMDY